MSKKRFAFVLPLVVSAVAVAAVGTSTNPQVPSFPTSPYPAVRYEFRAETEPKPQHIHVAAIDLTAPGVSVRVSRGGQDPDGEGPWQTTLMRPTKVADREGFDVVINGDFFAHLSGRDAEGAEALKQFKGSTPAKVTGPAATDGVVWSRTEKPVSILYFDAKNRPHLINDTQPPRDARNAIHAHDVLVKGGKNVAPVNEKNGFIKGPHPRTAVGYSKDGKTLFLVVADGRNKGVATGMSLSELAEVFVKLNADTAVNLDGGGSSVLAIRHPKTRQMTILNSPSDKDKQGTSRERPVGNVLGITVTKPGTR